MRARGVGLNVHQTALKDKNGFSQVTDYAITVARKDGMTTSLTPAPDKTVSHHPRSPPTPATHEGVPKTSNGTTTSE